jgi:hypothetical protein
MNSNISEIDGANLATNLINMEVNMSQLELMQHQLEHDKMNLLIVSLLIEIRDLLKEQNK